MHLNYTPLHLPHHLEASHSKKVSPLWFVVILVLIILQGGFIYLFFSGKIGGTQQTELPTYETAIPSTQDTSAAPDELVTEPATPSSALEVESEIDELEKQLEVTPEVTPAPDIPLDL